MSADIISFDLYVKQNNASILYCDLGVDKTLMFDRIVPKSLHIDAVSDKISYIDMKHETSREL